MANTSFGRQCGQNGFCVLPDQGQRSVIELVDLQFLILAAGRTDRYRGKFGIGHQMAFGAWAASFAMKDLGIFFGIA